MSETVIDETAFANLVAMTGDDFISELVTAYIEESPSLLAEMKRALAAEEAEAFSRAAHSLKSSSASLAALRFSDLARDLEKLGRAGDLGEAGARMEPFMAEYRRVEHALRAYQDEG
jgi:HPt (histidine-containing phosphotransfer) domain-containing protein